MCQNFGSSIVGLCFKDTADLSQQLTPNEVEWGEASYLHPNTLTVPLFTQRRRIDPKRYFIYLESTDAKDHKMRESDSNFNSFGLIRQLPKYLHDLSSYENVCQVFSIDKGAHSQRQVDFCQ